jgi:hypothetical protein
MAWLKLNKHKAKSRGTLCGSIDLPLDVPVAHGSLQGEAAPYHGFARGIGSDDRVGDVKVFQHINIVAQPSTSHFTVSYKRGDTPTTDITICMALVYPITVTTCTS